MSDIADAELVTAHLAGDRGALAAIYDRYADTLYDTAAAMTRNRHDAADVMQDVFVVAAERLGQLRDPSRLKPWLFAILRNEVYRRTGKGRRTVATDFTEVAAEMSLPPTEHDGAEAAEYEELAALVRGAAAGLDERDQLVLELTVRQGLEGDDLADALGVTPQQSYNLVHRMRQRTERSLGAYCVARAGRRDCPELAKILSGWDGEFTVLIRKRVARHVDGCDTCERKRRALAPLALFGAAPAFAAPADLRDRVLGAAGRVSPATGAAAGGAAAYGFARPGGFPSAVGAARTLALWIVVAAAALMLSLGTAVFVLADGGDDASSLTTTTLGAASGGTGTTTTVAGDGTLSASPIPLPATSTTTTVPDSTTTSSTSTSTSTSTTTSSTSTSTTTSTTSSTTSTTSTTSSTSTTTTTAPPTTSTTSTTPTTSSTTPPAPGSLSLSAGAVDFGTTVSSTRVFVSNGGGQPVDWSTTTGPVGFAAASSPFSVSPASGTLAPGALAEVVLRVDRAWPTEGPVSQRLTFVADGTSASIDLSAVIARPPQLVLVRRPPASACVQTGPFAASWLAEITDESPVTATATWTYPSGTRVVVTFVERNGSWAASVPFDSDDRDTSPDVGRHQWVVTATDQLGNASSANGTADVLGTC